MAFRLNLGSLGRFGRALKGSAYALAGLTAAGVLFAGGRGCTGLTHISRLERALTDDHKDRAADLGRYGHLTVLEEMYGDLDATCDSQTFQEVEQAIPRRRFIPFFHWMGRPFNYELAFDQDDHHRIATKACDDLISSYNPQVQLQNEQAPSLDALFIESPLRWDSLSPRTVRAIDSYRDTREQREHFNDLGQAVGPSTETLLTLSQAAKYDLAVATQDAFISGMSPVDSSSESVSDYIRRVGVMIESGIMQNREWFYDDTTYIGVSLALQSIARELTDQNSVVSQDLSLAEKNSHLLEIQSAYATMNRQRIAGNRPVLANVEYVGLTNPSLDFGTRNLAQELTALGSTEVTAIAHSFDPSARNFLNAANTSYSDPNKAESEISTFLGRRWREFQDTFSL